MSGGAARPNFFGADGLLGPGLRKPGPFLFKGAQKETPAGRKGARISALVQACDLCCLSHHLPPTKNGDSRPAPVKRPAIWANGDCPMALTIGSHPSSRRGFGPGVAVGAFVSTGPFTALRVMAGTSGMRSLLSVRFIVREVGPAEGAAVVAETWRPMRKQQATANPDNAIEHPERVNAIDMAKSPNSRPAKPSPQGGESSGIYFFRAQELKRSRGSNAPAAS